jgi:AhpD family alkylhydroperoxidase
VFADALPAFEGAVEALRDGIIPGALERNREFVGTALEAAPEVEEPRLLLGYDAQTSGGLLIAIAPERLESLQLALAKRGVEGFVIGNFTEPSDGRIVVANSTARRVAPPDRSDRSDPTDPSAASPEPVHPPAFMPTPSPNAGAHPADCCAEVFQPNAGSGSAAESRKAFSALMRAVQEAGALDARTKELILFSLVVYSRCSPCFEAHYAKARELGLMPEQLEEAAWCAIAMGGGPVRMFYQESLARVKGSESPGSESRL